MKRMKFKDIPDRTWFIECGGRRRMIRMQRTNGMCNFRYGSLAILGENLTPQDEAFVHKQPIVSEVIVRDNTGCIDYKRGTATHKGFNAVDEHGVVCCCPDEVEFLVPEGVEDEVQFLRKRVGQLTQENFDLKYPIKESEEV